MHCENYYIGVAQLGEWIISNQLLQEESAFPLPCVYPVISKVHWLEKVEKHSGVAVQNQYSSRDCDAAVKMM